MALHENYASSDHKLIEFLEKNILSKTSLKQNYDTVISRQSGYNYTVTNLKNRSVIGSLSPTKYMVMKNELKDYIEPVFIVSKKGDIYKGHYRSYLITNKKSNIKNLEKDFKARNIKKFYFISPTSTSGYIYPINYLYDLELIKSPCWCALKEEGINEGIDEDKIDSIFLGEVDDVHTAIDNDPFAVGAVWTPDTNKYNVLATIERGIPQDIFFITKDLKNYKQEIMKFLQDAIRNDSAMFLQSSQHITGLIPYDDDKYSSDYKMLLKTYEKVKDIEKENCSKGIIDTEYLKENKNPIVITIVTTILIGILGTIMSATFKPLLKKIKLWINKIFKNS